VIVPAITGAAAMVADANFGINAVDAVGQDELPRSGVKCLPLVLNGALHRLA
jgi:hypothetical protein